MKHFFFLLLLSASVIVIYLALSGHLSSQAVRLPGPGSALRPAPQAAEARRDKPVDTVNRVIRSGNNLGNNTRKAFESVDFGGKQ